jgi:hypothetical protein
MSLEISDEGGGATTEGAGKLNRAVRALARSGADTGGGTTLASIIRTGALEISRLTALGAGAITLPARAGLDRARSRDTLGAGATTCDSNDGAASERSRATRGDGGMMAGASAGATSRWSFEMLGAGGISWALSVGAMSCRSRCTVGAGAITESSCTPLRV